MERRNPFSDPAVPPTWAHLTRLGGDRVALLFEELRKLVSRNEDILERLDYAGPERGWVARYDLDGTTLFTARILPGTLEVRMNPDGPGRARLLSDHNLTAPVRGILEASTSGPIDLILDSSSSVRAFARLIKSVPHRS